VAPFLYAGEVFALAAAALWAWASLHFEDISRRIHPVRVALLKALVAIPLFLLVRLALHAFSGLPEPRAVLWLLASGVLGMGLSDAAYFRALTLLGAARTTSILTLTPAATAIGGYLFLGERLPPEALAGMALTMLGVAIVVWPRGGGAPDRGRAPAGLALSGLALITAAAGFLLNRHGVTLGAGMTVVDSALLRLLGGLLALGPLLAWIDRGGSGTAPWGAPGDLRRGVVASLAGTFVAFAALQAGIKWAGASITATLVATVPLWILPMVLLRGDRPPKRLWVGAGLAVLGVPLMFEGALSGLLDWLTGLNALFGG
jgi:drug/metabolite transporter (DMT)-like permease